MVLFGASTDRPERSRAFAASLELDYPLLSDRTREVARAYGVLRLGLVAARHTFIIDSTGRIADLDRAVPARGAAERLLSRLERLGVPRRGA